MIIIDEFRKLLNVYSYALNGDEFYLIRKSTGEIIDTFNGGRIIYKKRKRVKQTDYSITGKKFYRIYFDVLNNLDFTKNDYKILILFAEYTKFGTGEIMNKQKKPIGIKHIVDKTGISRSSANRTIEKFVKFEIIKKDGNMYYMNPFVINKTHKISGKLCNMFKNTEFAKEFEIAEITDGSENDIEL